MKSFFALAALISSAVAQRLTIAEPSTGQNITAGAPFTVELRQAVRHIPLRRTLTSTDYMPPHTELPIRHPAGERRDRADGVLRRVRRPFAVGPRAGALQRRV